MKTDTPPDLALQSASDDPRAYRRALGSFATGVCVVTADSEDDGPLGITVNSFTSVSLEPPLVLWCLAETSERWPAFSRADHFAVHVLAADQKPLSDRFSRGIAKLEAEEVSWAPPGVPVLTGALARFVCRTTDRLPRGDHVILIGEVLGFGAREAAALTFHAGRFASLGEG